MKQKQRKAQKEALALKIKRADQELEIRRLRRKQLLIQRIQAEEQRKLRKLDEEYAEERRKLDNYGVFCGLEKAAKGIKINPNPPEWGSDSGWDDWENVDVWTVKLPAECWKQWPCIREEGVCIDELMHSIVSTDVSPSSVSVCSGDPFSIGATRLAHHMKYRSGGKIHHWVVKSYMNPVMNMDKRAGFTSLCLQNLCIELAREFNKVNKGSARHSEKRKIKPVEFLEVAMFHFKERSPPVFLMGEPSLEDGDFEKFTNNTTFKTDGNRTIQAFSHFSHYFTGGKCMVVDLQGVKQKAPARYILTDPAMHSEGRWWGTEDFANAGMSDFFEVHPCNNICKRMGLDINPTVPFDPLESICV